MLNHHSDYNYYISGDIHKSLMELRQLKYLNLNGNNFEHNNIPGFFGSLINLRYLDLSNRNFEGRIHIQFESLLHLKYLNLSWNYLNGLIPHRLGNLSNLQFLDLSRNYLEGSIPSQLGNLSNLQFLDLNHNDLEGSIPSQLGKLTNLQELYIERMYVDSALTIDNVDHSGGQWLSNLTPLTHLHMLSISNLNKSNSWLQMVGKLPKLRELKLRNFGLSDHFIHSLSHSKFNFSTSLSILDLSLNNFVSSLIFQWVSNISSNLVELDLSGNQMVDPKSNHFSYRLPKLRELILSDNKFTSFIIFQWVSNISSNLVELDLSNNLMEDPPLYGHVIVMKNSLEILDLSNNRLKGGVFKLFMNVCTLRSLNLFLNKITQDLQTILHNLSSGCVRNSLQVLDLSYNGITGTLPDLSAFTSLKTLALSNNKLSGKIPEGGSLPCKLENLYIASNTLEGVIPKSFWMNACKLKSLDLSNNRFSGELQVLIQYLSKCARYSLQQLYLSSNQINGTLPDLSTFSFLEIFDISENKLNGKIFEDIRFPTKLRTLQMSSNSMNGVISEFYFSGMSMLKELDLSHNSLALTFTENWVPPFQLHIIGLISCKLGLTFPKWIQTQKYLEDLDISNAGISDNVPEGFWFTLSSQDCDNINVSNNNLKGLIPNLQVKNHCSVLSLSSNEFEGPIPPFLQGSTVIDLSKKNSLIHFHSYVQIV